MGYNTQFSGRLKFATALTAEQLANLKAMLGEDCRDHPEWEDKQGLTYIDLELTDDLDGLRWDGSEKTYDLVEKVNLVIREMRKNMPDFGLTGSMVAQGEDVDDRWELAIGPSGYAERKVIPTDELPKLREAAGKVVGTYWDDAREDFYRSAGKGPATSHVFHSLVELKRFAEGK